MHSLGGGGCLNLFDLKDENTNKRVASNKRESINLASADLNHELICNQMQPNGAESATKSLSAWVLQVVQLENVVRYQHSTPLVCAGKG